jgi:hypothetical protein
MTQNDSRMADLLKVAKQLGGEAALGKDSLPKLALAVAKAFVDGTMSFDKDSDKQDSVDHVYDAYKKGVGAKQIHEYTKDGDKVNKSKLRAIGKAAVITSVDFLNSMDKVLTLRKAELAAGNPVQGAYPALIAAARTQQKQETDLTDPQIAECVAKVAHEVTVEDELTRIYKALERVITGENKHGFKDQNEHTIAAAENLQARLATFARERDEAEVRAKAAALGWTMVDTSVDQAA